jgi:hypothetical protein
MAWKHSTTMGRQVAGAVPWLGVLTVLSAGAALWDMASRSPEPKAKAVYTPGAAAVNLVWDKSPSAGAVGYRVLYGKESGRYDGSLDVGNAAAATLRGLRRGDRYFIVVVALDAEGRQSPPSNEIQAIAR